MARHKPVTAIDWVGIADVAAWAGVHRNSVRRWIAGNHMPQPVRLGPTRLVWRREVIAAWLEERGLAPAASQAAAQVAA